MTDELSARCDCGWSARGREEELIPRIQQHALEAHGLRVSREQALEQARPAEPE